MVKVRGAPAYFKGEVLQKPRSRIQERIQKILVGGTQHLGARAFGRGVIWARGHLGAVAFGRKDIWARNTFKRIFNQLFVSFFLNK